MKKPKAVVSAVLAEPYLSKLKELCDVTLCGWAVRDGWILNEEECIQWFHNADFLITGVDQITRRVLDACPNVRLLACPRGKPVNIDRDAANERGLPIVYSPGRNANAVAEFLLGAVIGLIRKIPLSYHEVRNGKYLADPVEDINKVPERDDIVWGFNMPGPDTPFLAYEGYEMFRRTFGLIGYGAIGRRLNRFLKALEMRVVVYDPYLPPQVAEEDEVELLSMEELLQQSDFVSLHCAVTPETKGMIGKREFDLMKPTAVFINTARGVIVDQQSMLDALTSGRIAGAVLDVFLQEPMPANHPLLKMDNVVITPHLAGDSRDVAAHHSIMIVEDIQRFLNGEKLQFVFNKEVLG